MNSIPTEVAILIADKLTLKQKLPLALGQSFTGHPTVESITTCTSSIMGGLKNTPNLKQLILNEDMVMPIPHILLGSSQNPIFEMFKVKSLVELQLNCPLLFSINSFQRWSSIDMSNDEEDELQIEDFRYEILPNLKTLTLQKLNEEKLDDFFYGLIFRLKNLKLNFLSLNCIGLVKFRSRFFKNLTANAKLLTKLELKNFKLDLNTIQEIFNFGSKLISISFFECEFDFFGHKFLYFDEKQECIENDMSVPKVELGELILNNFCRYLNLKAIKFVNCKYWNVEGYSETYTQEVFNHTVNVERRLCVESLPQFHSSNLVCLNLKGFGILSTSVNFLKKGLYENLRTLKVDDIDSLNLNSLKLRNLKELDVKFTKYNKYILDSFVMDADTSCLPKLKKLSIYAPICVLNFLNFLSSQDELQELQVSYLPDFKSSELYQKNLSITQKHLKIFKFHIHTDGRSDALSFVKKIIFDGKSSNLKVLDIKKTMVSSAKKGGQNKTNFEENLVCGIEFMSNLRTNCKYLSSFKLVGIKFSKFGFNVGSEQNMVYWKSSLKSMEVTIDGGFRESENEVKQFLMNHGMLEKFVLGVEEFRSKNKEELQKLHEYLKKHYIAYTKELQREFWWVEQLEIRFITRKRNNINGELRRSNRMNEVEVDFFPTVNGSLGGLDSRLNGGNEDNFGVMGVGSTFINERVGSTLIRRMDNAMNISLNNNMIRRMDNDMNNTMNSRVDGAADA
ncbi:hypothetical protein HK099_006169 [Clydaea vesicula]|uniref:Uncharacterized protein n=1 Tax=Clydaea vesicula TaxID=447962 RepID=A0AAD5XUH6_9FUNG|nr:hypothetical protein HK099_006169 [Clydaea vesicula]